jgi:cytochrome b subunit of formate dehydrogenase
MANNKGSKAKINYFVDVVIGISFLAAAFSGLALFFAGSGGYQGGRNPRVAQEILGLSRLLWKDLHDWSGMVMLAGVFLHLVLHWKWIVCMTRNIFRKPSRSSRSLRPRAEVERVKSCPVEG